MLAHGVLNRFFGLEVRPWNGVKARDVALRPSGRHQLASMLPKRVKIRPRHGVRGGGLALRSLHSAKPHLIRITHKIRIKSYMIIRDTRLTVLLRPRDRAFSHQWLANSLDIERCQLRLGALPHALRQLQILYRMLLGARLLVRCILIDI